MAKEGTIKIEGTIIDVLPNAMFKVKLDVGTEVLSYVSGKMRQFEIRILMGDEMTKRTSVALQKAISKITEFLER